MLKSSNENETCFGMSMALIFFYRLKQSLRNGLCTVKEFLPKLAGLCDYCRQT